MSHDKRPGKLYGIGVGPGDPELLTLKAINAIDHCDVIAIPKAGEGEGTASAIVESYLSGKALLECQFVMEMDMTKRKEARQTVADNIIGLLKDGKDVGFITLGDPTTYSTYMYIHDIVVAEGYEATIIPGITSYAATAAALGVALCEDDETLTIAPARNGDNLYALLACPGNKVIMKSGSHTGKLLETLRNRGYGNRVYIGCRIGMDRQKLYHSIEDYEKEAEHSYFTIVIVKENK